MLADLLSLPEARNHCGVDTCIVPQNVGGNSLPYMNARYFADFLLVGPLAPTAVIGEPWGSIKARIGPTQADSIHATPAGRE
jgi:hypothetical protein